MYKSVNVPTLLLLVLVTSIAWADTIRIDYIDVSKYSKDGRLRFYVDVLDRKNRIIEEQDKDKLFFYLDDDEIAGDTLQSVDMASFEDIKCLFKESIP